MNGVAQPRTLPGNFASVLHRVVFRLKPLAEHIESEVVSFLVAVEQRSIGKRRRWSREVQNHPVSPTNACLGHHSTEPRGIYRVGLAPRAQRHRLGSNKAVHHVCFDEAGRHVTQGLSECPAGSRTRSQRRHAPYLGHAEGNGAATESGEAPPGIAANRVRSTPATLRASLFCDHLARPDATSG